MVNKEKIKENTKQATKWTLSKIWKGTVAACRYLWDGTKMLVVDLYRKIAKKRPKQRGLKARLKQAAAVGTAAGALVFGGGKAVQNYQNKDVRQRQAIVEKQYKEFANAMDYLYQKHGYPIDPKSSVWNADSNKGVFKLSQQELSDRQRFLNDVKSYLTIFVSHRIDHLSEPLHVQTQWKEMQESMGFDLVYKGQQAQEDPKMLKDYQICSKACNVVEAIVKKAQKQKSEYACFDRVKMELEKVKALQEETSKLQESSRNTTSVAHLRSGGRQN